MQLFFRTKSNINFKPQNKKFSSEETRNHDYVK